LTEILLLVIKLSVVALVFAIGLGSTPADLAYLWRRPGLLARSLLALYVAVPVAILLLVMLLPMAPAVRTAAVVLAISAGAPLLPKKLMKLGREGYVFSLVVTSSLLAIVAVPLWVDALGAVLGRDADVDSGTLARLLAKAFLGPLLLGMLARWPLAALAEKLSATLMTLAGAVLSVAGLVLLVGSARLLAQVGWPSLLTLGLVTAVALAVGHLLGGPDPDDRSALAVACASRHVGIAMLAAAAVPGPRTAALVVAYALSVAVVSAAYLRWRSAGKAPAASS
jgi:BASS family bile acid:Na+ symporter